MTTTSIAPSRTNGRSTLLGYAVLRANFSHQAPSYVDNFTPFVLDVLRDSHPVPLNEGEVGERVRNRFGLTIPDRVAGLLLKRSVKRADVDKVGRDTYAIAECARRTESSLAAVMAEFITQQSELMARFLEFVGEHHPERLALVDSDPSVHVHAFIERFAAPLLRRVMSGQATMEDSWNDLQGTDYLVAAFIRHLADHDARLFGYVVDAVKGAILTGVLDVGPGDLRQTLRGLTLIFDTPLLLSALGYHGEAQQRAMQQLLDLARALDIRIAYFEHTEREVSGILDAAAGSISQRGRSQMREVDIFVLEAGLTSADIAVMQDRLRADLEGLGLRILSRPNTQYQYGLDEGELESHLRERLPTQREQTRLYDVDSISAVHRLREGGSPDKFENCRFAFVSSNLGLLIAAKSLTSERHRWPLVMLDSEVASLLWVRQPGAAEDLPRQQLLAAVHAGMQPDGHLWMKYVEEIERLEQRGDVDANEAVVLRSAPEARRALMDVTLGDARLADGDSFGDVVGRVRESLSEPYRLDADDARRARDDALTDAAVVRRDLADARNAISRQEELRTQAERDAERLQEVQSGLDTRLSEVTGQLAALAEREAGQRERIRARAQKLARRRLSLCVGIPASILAILGAAHLIAPSFFKTLPSWIGIAATVVGGIGLIYTIMRGSLGGDLRAWLAPVEIRWAKRMELRELRRVGLDGDST